MIRFIHIGFPKTASTWLQREVFPRHPDIDFWSDWDRRTPDGMRCLTHLSDAHDFAFDADAMRTCLGLKNPRDRNQPLLISWEGFVGQYAAGGVNTKRNAERLKEVVGEARIIVTLRDQVSMVESLYLQYLRSGGSGSIESFLGRSERCLVKFSRHFLRYDRLIALYRGLFGDDAVKVVLFEQLQQDRDAFLRSMTDFMGVPPFELARDTVAKTVNPRLSWPSLVLLRSVNRLFWSLYDPAGVVPASILTQAPIARFTARADSALLARAFPVRGFLSRGQRRQLADFYRDGNRAVAESTGLALGDYGYPV